MGNQFITPEQFAKYVDKIVTEVCEKDEIDKGYFLTEINRAFNKMLDVVTYRVYAGDTVVHEDDFEKYDNATPYHDDYITIKVPLAVVDYIQIHS